MRAGAFKPGPCSADGILRDLRDERPVWPLSSFGVSKYAPTLVAGFDESPEELRVRAVLALQSNTIAEYVSHVFIVDSPSAHM
jgi:nucleoporin NUP42